MRWSSWYLGTDQTPAPGSAVLHTAGPTSLAATGPRPPPLACGTGEAARSHILLPHPSAAPAPCGCWVMAVVMVMEPAVD